MGQDGARSKEGFRSKLNCRNHFLTFIHNFSAIILLKYFFVKEVPPFHLTDVIPLVINRLDRVELWWNYGWNYMKFHPNSTRNSTTFKHLIIKTITAPRWKGGITNDKKYFSGKRQENILITVKKDAFLWKLHTLR